ncbi:Mur ligase family protein [Acidovorax sp.]|uniref:Mur ligase family protein n=1 Tax=Acidovorax sp. TaxID=1872122 RepID=UPI00391F483E
MNDSEFHPLANPLGTAAPEGVVTPAPAAAETGERLRAVDGAAVGMVAAQPKPPVTDATTAMAHTQLTAARDAAAFVAQIFAEVSAPEPTTTAQVLAGGDAAAQQDAASDAPGQPDGRPGEGIAPLHGQNILILGLGASGLAMARWCVRCGARLVTVADTRAAPPQLPALEQELPQVRFVSGALDAALVQGQELHAVYRSPGLSPAVIAPVVLTARADGASVGGELSLFSAGLAVLRAAHGYAPMVLAITGTNGKTTVTSLTGQLVERSGKRVAVAGNIGPTLLDTLASHIDAGSLPDVWVLELSSFQLDDVTGFEPTAATVLNITQDHLDWHGDMAAYASAKAHIFGETGLMILNRDDPEVMRMLPPPGRPKAAAAPSGGSAAHEVASVGVQSIPPPGRPKAAAAPPGGSAAHEVASVGGNTSSAPAKGRLTKPQVREHVTFGADMPRRPGDFGIEVVSGMPWLVRALAADETRKRGRQTQDEDLHIQRLMPADALRIRGRHNAVNALAALALASAAGCTLAHMLYGLREYRGEPHRVEPVAIVDGVEYFDDSKGTNVGATVAAVTGLGAERRVVVILGGEGKGQDFSPLAAPVARFARAVVLIGRDAPLIRAALADAGVALFDAATLPQAVNLAAQRAHAGDAVLLSPACASFDMFRDYEHRAQVFGEAVRSLADDAGVSLEGMA